MRRHMVAPPRGKTEPGERSAESRIPLAALTPLLKTRQGATSRTGQHPPSHAPRVGAGVGATTEEDLPELEGDDEAEAVGIAATTSARYHNWKWPVRPIEATYGSAFPSGDQAGGPNHSPSSNTRAGPRAEPLNGATSSAVVACHASKPWQFWVPSGEGADDR